MIAKNVFGYYRLNAFMSTQDPESNRFEYVEFSSFRSHNTQEYLGAIS